MFQKFAVSVLIALTIAAGFPVAVFARAPKLASPQAYLIKQHSSDTTKLESVAENIASRFDFSTDPNFTNVYSFHSQYGLADLRSILAGSYDYIEIDSTYTAKTATERVSLPRDPGFTTNGQNTDKQWGLPKAEFVDAWKKTTGSETVVVAVIDTGIDATHEDLSRQAFVTGYNVDTKQEINGRFNSDGNGHGTLIAGIIGAEAKNGRGVVGGAWDVALMPIKALNDDGSGSSSDVSEALVWAADHGASVINMSFGGLGFAHDKTLANAVSYAFNKNAVLIAAAGNDVAINGGNMNDNPVFPICTDNGENMIIGVTATDFNDLKPAFANYGKNCVDVSAPGRRILSTINHDPVTRQPSPDSYAFASGTSMAVPFVAAQAVLIKSLYPQATNKQIRDRIISTTDSIDKYNLSQCGDASCRGLLGSGRINVKSSLEEDIKPLIAEGDVVKLNTTGELFYINGAKRHAIFPFVYNQRFSKVSPKTVSMADLQTFPEGGFAEPLDGTLIKSNINPTVYYMANGVKQPVTGQVFALYGFSFNNVNVLSTLEVDSWIMASLLPPPDGSLIRSARHPTVYWVVAGVLHPVNDGFYKSRGLNIFPLIYVSDEDLKGFSKGEAYIL